MPNTSAASVPKAQAHYTRKQLDQLTDYVKRPQIGAKGMVYARVEADGNVKSSVDKFYSQEVLQQMKAAFNAKPGDLILILSGDDAMKTRKQLSELRASKWDASSACATRINSHASG